MTEPTIDLDAILKPYIRTLYYNEVPDYLRDIVLIENAKKAMLQACKECLRVASEKATTQTERNVDFEGTPNFDYEVVDKSSILQVEKLIKL